jgi:hypothetical protein
LYELRSQLYALVYKLHLMFDRLFRLVHACRNGVAGCFICGHKIIPFLLFRFIFLFPFVCELLAGGKVLV